MPPELGQPRRVRGQGVLHGGRQSFHPQKQGTNGRFSRSPFGNFLRISSQSENLLELVYEHLNG